MTTESGNADDARARAEDRFKRMTQQKTDAEKVWVERDAQQVALLERTERLRQLRLAKEQSDRDAGSAKKKVRATRQKPIAAGA